MDFSVELLHSTEKKLNAEISRLMKAVKVSTVSDLNSNTLGKLQKAPSASNDFLNSFVTLLESNMSLCKAAASAIDEMKSKVLDTQNQLIHRQQDELAKVKDTVQTEMKSWADVARKNEKQNRQLTAKSVKEAVKAVSEEEERSKNVIVYGVTDEEETDWEDVLKIDKASETVKSICEVTDCLNVEVQSCSRIGMWKSDKIRPIKVQLRTSSDVDLLLRRACKLKSSEEFSGVYLAPDRTP